MKSIKTFAVILLLTTLTSCGGRKDRCPSVVSKTNISSVIFNIFN